MVQILLIVQIIVAISMVLIILIQKTSNDSLAGLGGGSGGNSILSGRASANILTKITTFLAAFFMINSLTMAAMISREQNQNITDIVVEEETKSENAEPVVPLAK